MNYSRKTPRELVAAVGSRYRQASRSEKKASLAPARLTQITPPHMRIWVAAV
jgi:hypothetical protein